MTDKLFKKVCETIEKADKIDTGFTPATYRTAAVNHYYIDKLELQFYNGFARIMIDKTTLGTFEHEQKDELYLLIHNRKKTLKDKVLTQFLRE